jgi:hypothetical protein
MFAVYRNQIETQRNAAFESGSEWDGRAVWQPMKNKLSDKPIMKSWSYKVNVPAREALRKDILELNEFNPDGSMCEINHFLMQCVRIPVNDEPSARKIMQVALNIGQLRSEIYLQDMNAKTAGLYLRFKALGMEHVDAYIDLDG